MLTWAAHISEAAENNDKPFTTVSQKKTKPTPPPLIPKPLPRIERDIIITCNKSITKAQCQDIAAGALLHLNNYIRTTAKIDQPPFILARITSNNKLVLTTNPTIPATAYTPYIPVLLNEIKPLKPTTGQMNSR
jgi:hypothetical protein